MTCGSQLSKEIGRELAIPERSAGAWSCTFSVNTMSPSLLAAASTQEQGAKQQRTSARELSEPVDMRTTMRSRAALTILDKLGKIELGLDLLFVSQVGVFGKHTPELA